MNPSQRKWIVKRKVLESGEIKTIPDDVPGFLHIHTNNPLNIFRMFSNGQFGELYIFGLDLEVEREDLYRISAMVKDMGSNVVKVYYCGDEIPSEWEPILRQFKVVGTDEGLKLLQKYRKGDSNATNS